MKQISKICIVLSNLFQFYIVFTIAHIYEDGLNEYNLIMLLFNIAYIISLQTYNNKIDLIYEQRGKYFSLKYDKTTEKEKNQRNKEICKYLFEDVFDGDFRN